MGVILLLKYVNSVPSKKPSKTAIVISLLIMSFLNSIASSKFAT